MDFKALKSKMRAGRPPFMSPERVARELRDGVADGSIAFTAASDVDVVIELYTKGFVAAINGGGGGEPKRARPRARLAVRRGARWLRRFRLQFRIEAW